MDFFLLAKFISKLILPPAGPILAVVVGLLVRRRWRSSGTTLAALGALAMIASTLPISGYWLHRHLQAFPAVADAHAHHTTEQAIVVLGGGRQRLAPEYGGEDTLSATPLVRVRYAAKLQRETGLPVLTTGGTVNPKYEKVPEAELMAAVLKEEFGVPVRWRETRSRNTFENAKFSVAILKLEGVEHVYLVSHASHMQRSVAAFQGFGLRVSPAPTALMPAGPYEFQLSDIVPDATALKDVREALHEYLGRVWYAVRY